MGKRGCRSRLVRVRIRGYWIGGERRVDDETKWEFTGEGEGDVGGLMSQYTLETRYGYDKNEDI